VPEPATWAMMIAGFGIVGSAVRRRRPAALAA
ncbi:MAG: PEPxxWA-CTERM sorting domain-containing protein, partial [Phenylobacterium sp.]